MRWLGRAKASISIYGAHVSLRASGPAILQLAHPKIPELAIALRQSLRLALIWLSTCAGDRRCLSSLQQLPVRSSQPEKKEIHAETKVADADHRGRFRGWAGRSI